MLAESKKNIWTIGHSTRSEVEFLSVLKSFQIEVLVDVRKFPGSRKFPQFNILGLEQSLPQAGIEYLQNPGLGGRRKPKTDSRNLLWNNISFRGYADYAETPEFKTALEKLLKIATKRRTAYMCSEAVWWRCHRAIISDILKFRGWTVMHIMKENTANEHPYTSVFRKTHSL